MALTTPTVDQIADNIIAQLEATLGQTIPNLPKSFLRVLSKVAAGIFILVYKYGGGMHLNQFVATASGQDTEVNGVVVNPLSFWGDLFGVSPRQAATQAVIDVEFNTTASGDTLPAGTLMIGPNGVTYATLNSQLIDTAVETLEVIAVADQQGGDGSGEVGNLPDGAECTLVNSFPYMAKSGIVAGGPVVYAQDQETEESYRKRIQSFVARRPQGGAYADYRAWGLEASGIINIYPYSSPSQSGQADVYAESGTEPDGIPSGAQLTAVENEINQADRLPVSVVLNVLPITRKAFDVEIDTLDVPNEASVQAQILSALTDFFLGREPFIDGLSVLPRLDKITQTTVTAIVEDVVSAAGGSFIGLTVNSGGPIIDYTLASGEKAKVGSVTYI